MIVTAVILAHSYFWWWGAQLIAVGILVFLFLRWRPTFLGGRTIGQTVGSTLDAREEQIRIQLSAAEESRREAARIREESAADIARARSEADDVVKRAEHTSQAIQQEIVTRAEEEKQRIITQASTEIDYERRQAEQALRRRAADIVVDAAEEVVRRHMDSTTDQRLIGESLNNLRKLT